ncbi:MAG: flagellar hook basal-body protein [Deltaproteobacteria bacterium]|nr:flagellar hook basal-body protein [Deltaproteobacteria bacterium]
MTDGIYTALSGAMADASRIDIISNNLANVSTAGFKQFTSTLNSTKGAAKAKELDFVQIGAVTMDNEAGPLKSTGNPLDIALSANVFMAVEEKGREAYVHGASLLAGPDGNLMTVNGQPVYDTEKQLINISPDAKDVSILPDGTVTVDGEEAGKIKLIEFANTKALKKNSGKTVIDGGGANPSISTLSRPVMSGYLEQANIDAIRGMTDLIAAHRSYEAAVKAIQTHGEIEKRAANDIAGRI